MWTPLAVFLEALAIASIIVSVRLLYAKFDAEHAEAREWERERAARYAAIKPVMTLVLEHNDAPTLPRAYALSNYRIALVMVDGLLTEEARESLRRLLDAWPSEISQKVLVMECPNYTIRFAYLGEFLQEQSKWACAASVGMALRGGVTYVTK